MRSPRPNTITKNRRRAFPPIEVLEDRRLLSSGTILSGGTESGYLSAGGKDSYTFYAPAGSHIIAAIGTTSGNLTARATLNGPGLAVSPYVTGDASGVLTPAAPQSGIYTLTVTDFNGGAGSYNLSMASAPGPQYIGPDGNGGAVSAGQTVNGTLDLGDIDVYTFSANAGDQLTLGLRETGGATVPTCDVFAPNGASFDSFTGTTTDSLTANVGGPYIAVIRNYNFGYATGSYSFSLGVTHVTSQTGSISGIFFNDKNANGTRDASDSGMAGWQAYADLNGNALPDPADAFSTVTGASGQYTISNLPPGTYRIYEVRPNGWTRTDPAGTYPLGYHTVTVKPGQNSAGNDFGDIPPVAWGARVSTAFKEQEYAVANAVGADASQLMAVMAFETGQSFSPSIQNSQSGAVGLIQFTTVAESAVGKTAAQLKAMTAVQQLAYVEKYLLRYKGRIGTIENLYMAVLAPAYISSPDSTAIFKKGSLAYEENIGLDLNHDGIITKAEAASKVMSELSKGEGVAEVG